MISGLLPPTTCVRMDAIVSKWKTVLSHVVIVEGKSFNGRYLTGKRVSNSYAKRPRAINGCVERRSGRRVPTAGRTESRPYYQGTCATTHVRVTCNSPLAIGRVMLGRTLAHSIGRLTLHI